MLYEIINTPQRLIVSVLIRERFFIEILHFTEFVIEPHTSPSIEVSRIGIGPSLILYLWITGTVNHRFSQHY